MAAAGAAGAEPSHAEVRRSHAVHKKRAGGERAAFFNGRGIVEVRLPHDSQPKKTPVRFLSSCGSSHISRSKLIARPKPKVVGVRSVRSSS